MATNEAQETGFSSLGFVRQFVVPALLVFLIPTASLLFFRHAQATLDAQVREAWLAQVEEDASLSDEERVSAR